MLNIMERTIEYTIPFVVCKGHSRTIKLLTVQIHTVSICIHSLPCVAKYNREISRCLAHRVGHLSHGNMLAVQGRM